MPPALSNHFKFQLYIPPKNDVLLFEGSPLSLQRTTGSWILNIRALLYVYQRKTKYYLVRGYCCSKFQTVREVSKLLFFSFAPLVELNCQRVGYGGIKISIWPVRLNAFPSRIKSIHAIQYGGAVYEGEKCCIFCLEPGYFVAKGHRSWAVVLSSLSLASTMEARVVYQVTRAAFMLYRSEKDS